MLAWMDPRRRRGPLDAAELAEAAVLGDLALVLIVAGWFLPAGIVLYLAATLPYAALTVRRRVRTAVVAGLATGSLAFVLGGISLATNLGAIAALGAAVGIAYKRGYRRTGTLLTTVVLVWIPGAAITLATLAVFSRTRELTLKQIDIGTRWIRHLLTWLGERFAGSPRLQDAFDNASKAITNAVHWSITHWWIVIPAGEFVAALVAALICRRVALPALRRLDATFTRAAIVEADDTAPANASDAPIAPVPVTLRGVSYRYPGAAADAISGVDLTIPRAQFVAIVGDNGSGKSTLASVIAGSAPTAGTVERDGAVGTGKVGGTARVFQRPESQVLGARVADDVRWGTPRDAISDNDIDTALARVGLDGFAMRDTETLSGGELQRLAIASALARQPALFVSDESTAMLDPEGRATVLDVLARLRAAGTTVVHVTHEPDEAARADLVVVLDNGRVRAVGPPDDVLASEEMGL
jgi:energy-coupling factor transport system ATP-binding protein